MNVRPGISAVRKIVEAGKGELEGTVFTVVPSEEIQVGDKYVAGFNTGPHLLTARSVNAVDGWIVSEEGGYSFDTVDCVKVNV